MDALDRSQKLVAVVGAVIGIFGMVMGAGIAYQALKSQVDSQQLQISRLERRVEENEKSVQAELKVIGEGIGTIKTGIARLEERISGGKQ